MKYLKTEHEEQVEIFEWRDVFKYRFEELDLLYAIPNGGHRHKATAARLKAEGVTPGIPDLHLPIPKGAFCSLYIELKRARGGVVTKAQKTRIKLLKKAGNKVEICCGKDAAIQTIIDYLNL